MCLQTPGPERSNYNDTFRICKEVAAAGGPVAGCPAASPGLAAQGLW
jgi:hypothetical protein